ncbi:MAG: phosphopantothenoylcysteine decarboxylase, partial [Coriobacteriaceae bacterium]|nr:phosphopantothenoylcysteine decarboxylase [Coriobacteriaceae bacterium]
VVDDLALPFGTLRLKGKGSDAGHNGLKHIAATLGTAKRAGQVQVVYAAETGNPLPAARGKLQRKNAELCVANDVSSGVGFGTPDNRVWLVEPGSEQELPLLSKRQLAGRILDRVAQLLA